VWQHRLSNDSLRFPVLLSLIAEEFWPCGRSLSLSTHRCVEMVPTWRASTLSSLFVHLNRVPIHFRYPLHKIFFLCCRISFSPSVSFPSGKVNPFKPPCRTVPFYPFGGEVKGIGAFSFLFSAREIVPFLFSFPLGSCACWF